MDTIKKIIKSNTFKSILWLLIAWLILYLPHSIFNSYNITTADRIILILGTGFSISCISNAIILLKLDNGGKFYEKKQK